MKIKVFKEISDELSFHYTELMEPEIVSENINYFTVGYLGEDQDGNESFCMCDYPADKYYYETKKKER